MSNKKFYLQNTVKYYSVKEICNCAQNDIRISIKIYSFTPELYPVLYQSHKSHRKTCESMASIHHKNCVFCQNLIKNKITGNTIRIFKNGK